MLKKQEKAQEQKASASTELDHMLGHPGQAEGQHTPAFIS